MALKGPLIYLTNPDDDPFFFHVSPNRASSCILRTVQD
jgi:hypothetical protein